MLFAGCAHIVALATERKGIWMCSGPGIDITLGASGSCAQCESTTVLRRSALGNALRGANNVGKASYCWTCGVRFSPLDVRGPARVGGRCYHRNDGAKRAVWMYILFSVRRASSVPDSYNLQHSNRKSTVPTTLVQLEVSLHTYQQGHNHSTNNIFNLLTTAAQSGWGRSHIYERP